MIAPVNDDFTPNRWMLLSSWSKRTGYSRHTFNHKRQQGIWHEGQHWIKAPDGKILVDWRQIELWMESNYDQLENTAGG